MGYAILHVPEKPGSFNTLISYGTEHVENYKTNPNPSDVPDYDKVKTAQNVATAVLKLVVTGHVEMVVIEQTNPGKFRTAQKELEFIHFAVVNILQQHKEITKQPLCVKYIDTSKWR